LKRESNDFSLRGASTLGPKCKNLQGGIKDLLEATYRYPLESPPHNPLQRILESYII